MERVTRPSGCWRIEGTAGQGTNLGWRFEHVRDMIAASRYPDRIAVCLDTCHLFAAGYPLRTPDEWRGTLAGFDATVGLARLRVLHLIDPRREFGSRVDRHARIGEGEIGLEGLREFVNHPAFRNVPLVLETPKKSQDDDPRNLKTVRSMFGT